MTSKEYLKRAEDLSARIAMACQRIAADDRDEVSPSLATYCDRMTPKPWLA